MVARPGVDQEQANTMVSQAIEAGINFFDTANVSSYGLSEEILHDTVSRQ